MVSAGRDNHESFTESRDILCVHAWRREWENKSFGPRSFFILHIKNKSPVAQMFFILFHFLRWVQNTDQMTADRCTTVNLKLQ